jgi:uncharacterized membrane protein
MNSKANLALSTLLALVQGLVQQSCGRAAGWGLVVGALALGSLGVYVGRFLRWNSWDLLRSPVLVLGDVAGRIAHPFSHPRAAGFWALSFILLSLTYLMCYLLARCTGHDRASAGKCRVDVESAPRARPTRAHSR